MFARDEQGLGMCNINVIIALKERVVDRKYDPLVWLGSKIARRSS